MSEFPKFVVRWTGPRLVLSLMAIAWSVSCVCAAPSVTEKNAFYDVRGSTAAEVRNKLNALGHKSTDGKTFDGLTESQISWRFTRRSTGYGCAMDSVNTTVNVTFTMPQWVDRYSAPQDVRLQWDAYYEALRRHEEGHKEIAVQGAREIEQALLTMSARDCAQLDAQANAKGHQILELVRARQRQYDARTEHGKTQGAKFP